MPELPEVETVCRGIAPFITHNPITQVTLHRPDLRFPFPDDFAKALTGQTVQNVTRRAKYILCELDNGLTWLTHLGMSGRMVLYPKAKPYPPAKHDHVVITFADGLRLVYHDPRRFGYMDVVPSGERDAHPYFAHLGPEPFSNHFHVDYLHEKLRGRACSIKSALLDQRVIVGVGNIYACEALFRAGISPLRKAGNISPKRLEKLVAAIKTVLREAIDSGGSTLRDYVRSSGDSGYFQHRFQVYGREGKPCCCTAKHGKINESLIKRIVQQGRSTWYCPACQT